MRILDIAMNPNSLYIDRKRSINSHVSAPLCHWPARHACMLPALQLMPSARGIEMVPNCAAEATMIRFLL